MYIVKVPFDYQKEGKIIKAKVGDSLPDFESWPYVCQKAHLNLDWVEKVKDEEKPEEKKIANVQPLAQQQNMKGRKR